MSEAAQALAAILSVRRPGVVDVLRAESSATGAGRFDTIAFEATFAAVGRRVGSAAVGPATISDDACRRTWSIATWGLDELARALLLLDGITHIPPPEQSTWIHGCYLAGALRERQAVLRTLALFPEPERFLPLALDACRNSTQPIFEAIACENPYPAAYFSESSFNHMVLKAVFTEVPLARILDLTTRRTLELARMASDYASERTAAGRSVPTDLALLIDG